MNTVENDFIRFWIEGGIMFSEYKIPVNLTLDHAKKIIELRHEISRGEKQYWCYNFTGVKDFPKEVRDYADIHGQEFLHASAAIVSSQITMFIVNIFVKIKSPQIPFRAFKSKEDAIKWLNEKKKEFVKIPA